MWGCGRGSAPVCGAGAEGVLPYDIPSPPGTITRGTFLWRGEGEGGGENGVVFSCV